MRGARSQTPQTACERLTVAAPHRWLRRQTLGVERSEGGGGEGVVDEVGEPPSLDQLDLVGMDAGDA